MDHPNYEDNGFKDLCSKDSCDVSTVKLDHFKKWIKMLDEHSVHFSSRKPLVILGCTGSVACIKLPEILSHFRQRFSDVSLLKFQWYSCRN